MSWVPNRVSFGRAALAALLVTAAASATADVLVVRSSGPSAKSYPAGRSLPDNAQIALRPGDTLVVLGSGGTRTFRGPGTFSPSGPVQSGQRIATSGNRRARVGAVRNAGVVPRSPTIWHVDVSHGGTVCIVDPENVLLWRPASAETVTLTISPPAGAPRTLEWAAGQPTLAWPDDMPVTPDAEYRLSTGAEPVPLVLKPLDTVPQDLNAVAGALIEKGCEEQLDLFIATAPTATASAE